MSDRELEFLLCDTALKWRRRYSDATKKLDLQGLERRIILTLHKHTNITQVVLADFLEQEPQSLTRILDRMVTKNLIQKTPHQTDRRANCLSLTTTGKRIYQKVMAIANKDRPALLSNFNEKELAQLFSLLKKLEANLDQ